MDNLYRVTMEVSVYVDAYNMIEAEEESRGHLSEATVERVIHVDCMER